MERLDHILTGIAKTHLNLSTLETRCSDHLDFSDVSVWAVRAALEAAFHAGVKAAARDVSRLSLACQKVVNCWENGDLAEAARACGSALAKLRKDRPLVDAKGDLPRPFDAYEIHGVREFGRGQSRYCEQVPDHEAQFWSIYGHIPGQGLECIGDFKSRQLALEVYARITGEPYAKR